MESKETLQMYVSDPVENKETIGSHTSYTLQGARVPEPLQRRYRDFDALRRKLQERWPGIFIPNIPHKKTIGNKDKEIVDMRIEMINRFCQKISKIGYLFNSDEMELFLQNSNDVPKTLSGIKAQSYEELLKKYNNVFSDYDDNFDTNAGKVDQDKFLEQLNQNYPRLRSFRASILAMKERYKDIKENYMVIINMLSLYEKEAVNNYVNLDENKLVFFNMKNLELNQNISKCQEDLINPYDRLYDSLTEDYLDTEAMQEAFESLNHLRDTYDKLTKSLTATNTQLIEMQTGKTNIKSILSFKSRDEDISKLMQDKVKLEEDINCLGKIIKIVTFVMQKEIKNFKGVSLDNYYVELNNLEADTERSAQILDTLWESVVKDKNISEYN